MKLDFNINKPIDVVYDCLSDMQKFCSVHPVIFKVDDKGKNQYLIHEKLSFIPFPFVYPTTVERRRANNEIAYHATIMKLIKVEMHFVLSEEGMTTQVDETIQFKSMLPISFLMKRVFKKQHAILFKNIEAVRTE